MRAPKLLLLLISITLPICVRALTLDDLTLRMHSYPTLRCHYVQLKQIRELAAPLSSEGSMLLSQELGLYWQQEIPFRLELTATDSSFSQKLEGQDAQVVSREANPQLFDIIQTLKALFSGDKAVLERNFDSALSSEGENYVLTLTPKAEPFNLIFSKIEVSGAKFMEQLKLYDKGGDLTSLNFTQYKTQPEQLTDDEKAHFTR